MRFRKLLTSFKGYSWEIPTWKVCEITGLEERDIKRLDTNTSPFQPDDELSILSRKAEKIRINEYPDATYKELRERISEYTGKQPENIVVTNGADEALDIIAKVFLEKGDEALIVEPTYSMFRIVSEIMGARVSSLQADESFKVEVDRIVKSVGRRTKVLFLCNPNNPTGGLLDIGMIEKIAKEVKCLIAVDEAYFEFAGRTVLGLLENYSNLVVCRTFSKAFSLAGARVGYMVAPEEIVSMLNKVRPPNSVSTISYMLAAWAIKNKERMMSNVRRIIRERERILESLNKIDGISAYKSWANFVLFKVMKGNASIVHEKMMMKGILLRDLSKVSGTENCLRVTVSTKEVNDLFLEYLSELV